MKYFIILILLISSSAFATYRNLGLDPSDAYYAPPILQPISTGRNIAGYYDNNYFLLQYKNNLLLEKQKLEDELNQLNKLMAQPLELNPYQQLAVEEPQIYCFKAPCPTFISENDSLPVQGNFEQLNNKQDPAVMTERLEFVPALDLINPSELSQEY